MRRGLILVLIFCMCIPFVSFGAEITDIVTYKDTETGYTYFFGKFSDDLKASEDIGFEIGDRYFSLNKQDVNDPSKTAFEVACENGNIFGIGIKNLSKAFGSEFNVTPYIKTGNEIKFMENSLLYTTYNKNPEVLAAYQVEGLKPGSYDPEGSEAEFKTVSDNNRRLTTSKSSSGEIYSSYELLLRYDISDFEGVSDENRVILKIYAAARVAENDSKGGKLKIVTVMDEDYDGSKGYYHDTSVSIVSENGFKNVYSSLSEAIFEEFTFDVSEIVNSKLKNNEESVTFVIQLNNDKVRDRAYVSLSGEYDPVLIIE